MVEYQNLQLADISVDLEKKIIEDADSVLSAIEIQTRNYATNGKQIVSLDKELREIVQQVNGKYPTTNFNGTLVDMKKTLIEYAKHVMAISLIESDNEAIEVFEDNMNFIRNKYRLETSLMKKTEDFQNQLSVYKSIAQIDYGIEITINPMLSFGNDDISLN